ncbi:MAG: ribosome small subunit-dependent GTPase A [Clostridiales bacterium]|nr:ribosome small subunit-dependent GTPase A [Clostridiales bacterium]
MNNNGMIIKCVAGVYDVLIDGKIYSAVAKGNFRSKKLVPLVGDMVCIKFSERKDEQNLITEILPRKNALLRPPVANVDTLLITVAVKKPNPDLKLADHLICYSRMLGIEPIICINKSDFDENEAKELALQFQKSDLRTFITSSYNVEGVEELRHAIKKGITCFSGQSAVGKSTLTNLLLGREMFKTGGLSKKTERGKHTTRHSELVLFDKGKYLADTPGFSLLEMPDFSPDDFKNLYYEYEKYSYDCRFNGCNHINEPDCAVKEAVLKGELSQERYDRYKVFYNEVNEKWRNRYD